MSHSSLIAELALDIGRLSKTLTTLAQEIESVPSQASATENAKKAPKTTKNPEVPDTSTQSSSKESEEIKPSVSIEEVRAVLADISQSGGTAKVKELLNSFGAAKLSAVPADKLPELLEAASAVKEG